MSVVKVARLSMEQQAESNEAMPTRMFLYCWQPECKTARAVFAPFDLLDHEEQERIAAMHQRGPIFWQQWQRYSPSRYELQGYRLADGQLDTSPELARFLKGWQQWAELGARKLCKMSLRDVEPTPGEKQCLFYYMDDELGDLAPEELYARLCRLTFFDGQPVDVQYCILDTALTEEPIRLAPFSYSRAKNCTSEDLRDGLLRRIGNTGEQKIYLFDEDATKGEGWVCFVTNEQKALLNNTTLAWDGNTVVFRRRTLKLRLPNKQ